jgi:hypothetical protein
MRNTGYLSLLAAAVAVSSLFGFGHRQRFPTPLPATAKADDKGQIHVRYHSSTPVRWQEQTFLRKDEKGETKPVAIRFAYGVTEEHSVSLPLKAVAGFDTEGNPLEPNRLAVLLAKETLVILHEVKPDPKLFSAFKKDIPVLILNVELDPNAVLIQTPPVGPVPVEPKPTEPKPVDPKPVDPKPVEPKPEEPKKEKDS